MNWLADYFGLPAGAVWSNLVASLICVGFAWWRLRARMISQHVQALAQSARHHHEKLDQAEAHHQAAMKQAEEDHQAVVKHLGKQSAHLVRQDNAMRDLKGASR